MKQERTRKNHSKKAVWIFILISVLSFNAENLSAQINHVNGLTLSAGAYSAAGISTNPFFGLRFNRYLEKGTHFFEFSYGFSSIESKVLNAVTAGQLFENNNFSAIELVYGYDPKMWTSFPYFTAGVANISQGGQSKLAGVLGIGNRILIDSIFGSKNFGFRYDIRDHILTQRFNNEKAFMAHNFVLTVNLEYFF